MTIELNQQLKHAFIGISLSPQSNTETGIAILDNDLKIMTLDKAFSMQDISHFFSNYPSKNNAVIAVSMADDVTMLNSKWKVLAKKFQVLAGTEAIRNRQGWVNKYTNRAAELLLQYKNEGVDVFRFDLPELKKALGLAAVYKDRSPADCKYLQNALKVKFLLQDIMTNMLPASQLEAILGAILAHTIYYGHEGEDYKVLYDYKGLEVVNFARDNFV